MAKPDYEAAAEELLRQLLPVIFGGLDDAAGDDEKDHAAQFRVVAEFLRNRDERRIS